MVTMLTWRRKATGDGLTDCRNGADNLRHHPMHDDTWYTYRCPELQCSKMCTYGFRVGSDGCVSCDCAASVCEGMECPGGELCREETLPCLTAPCPVKAVCKPIGQAGEKLFSYGYVSCLTDKLVPCCVTYLFFPRMHLVLQSHVLCLTVPCTLSYSPMHLVLQSHVPCLTVPCPLSYCPMCLVLQSHVPCLTVPCALSYSPMYLVLQSHAPCLTVPCTLSHAPCLTVPCILSYSPIHLALQSNVPCLTVPCTLSYCPMCLVLQSHPPCLTVPCTLFYCYMYLVLQIMFFTLMWPSNKFGVLRPPPEVHEAHFPQAKKPSTIEAIPSQTCGVIWRISPSYIIIGL